MRNEEARQRESEVHKAEFNKVIKEMMEERAKSEARHDAIVANVTTKMDEQAEEMKREREVFKQELSQERREAKEERREALDELRR